MHLNHLTDKGTQTMIGRTSYVPPGGLSCGIAGAPAFDNHRELKAQIAALQESQRELTIRVARAERSWPEVIADWLGI